MTFGVILGGTNPGPVVQGDSSIVDVASTPAGNRYGQSTTDPIGFYGTTPIAKQAATVPLTTQLENLGLIPTGTPNGKAPVNTTAATLTLTQALHAGRVVTVNKADGSALTLPAATGTGDTYIIEIGTTITSVGSTIKAANATDVFRGMAWVMSDNSAAVLAYLPAATDDTVTLNGTTTGGYAGHLITIRDVAAGVFNVQSFGKATGTEATPFSATVS